METLVGGVIALGTLAWSVWTWYEGRGGEVFIFIVDQRGNPRPDVTILGPGGVSLSPDVRGMASLPRSWSKKYVSIHDRHSWRELMKVQLSKNGEVPQKIVIPDE